MIWALLIGLASVGWLSVVFFGALAISFFGLDKESLTETTPRRGGRS